MRPGVYNLSLYQGDSYVWQYVVWADQCGGVPADLTGVTAAAQIRDQPGGTTVVELICEVMAPNIIHVTLTAEAAAGLPARGGWDLQLTYADGMVVTLVAGWVTVAPDYTRVPA